MAQRTCTCPECGAHFTTTHPRKKWCSNACTRKGNGRVQNSKRHAPKVIVACATCRTEFQRPRSDSRHCSVRCRNKEIWATIRQPAPLHTLKCVHCEKMFESKFEKTKLCSDRCRKQYGYLRNADDRRAYSRAWNKKNSKTEAYRDAHKVKWNNRRALMTANPDSIGVPLKEWRRIKQRANGHCFYCSARTGRLTMDHVVPLGRGGRHALANVVAACGSCNYSKGDKLLIEWRAFKAKWVAAGTAAA